MKIKIIAIIMAVLMVGSAIAFFATKGEKKEEGLGSLPTVYSYSASEYTAKVSVVGENGEIYLPTDVDGLYYTATLNNDINFYQYSNGSFTKVSYEVQKETFYLSATYEKIPVKVSYINAGDVTVGYGVFTSDMDKSVDIYDYAFVKIVVAPANYQSASGYLLLADFNKDNFYKADKTYSEIYKINENSPNVSTILSNNTRLIDKKGGFRQDWSMLTDEFLYNIGSANYFMSSRYYSEAETGKRTDIMVYSNAYRPTIVAEDIVGTWFINDNNGIHYLKSTENGFEHRLVNGDETKVINSFEGNYFDDYIRDGNYLLNKKSGEITNILSNSKFKIDDITLTDVSDFKINESSTKVVLVWKAVTNENAAPIQKVVYYALDNSKETEVYSEPLLYSEEAGFEWIDDNTVLSVRPISESGEISGSIIYSF